jgi:predicted RNA-binding Zn-ribbon protein involved in translation (DUF1610 family)
MPETGDFSRIQGPEHDELDHGDLHPYVCPPCRDRMADTPHWDRARFVRPEEKLVSASGGGRALRTDGGTSTSDTEPRPRTRAPTNQWGETLSRFSTRLDWPCDNCGHDSLDQWISEGATETAVVCPTCGHVHDDDRARELYEHYGDTDTSHSTGGETDA